MVTAAYSRNSDTNITAIFEHVNMSHVSFLHDSKVFISCLCSGFELLVYFYMFYWVWTKSLNLKEIFVYSTITTFYCLLSIITDCFTSQMCSDQSD